MLPCGAAPPWIPPQPECEPSWAAAALLTSPNPEGFRERSVGISQRKLGVNSHPPLPSRTPQASVSSSPHSPVCLVSHVAPVFSPPLHGKHVVNTINRLLRTKFNKLFPAFTFLSSSQHLTLGTRHLLPCFLGATLAGLSLTPSPPSQSRSGFSSSAYLFTDPFSATSSPSHTLSLRAPIHAYQCGSSDHQYTAIPHPRLQQRSPVTPTDA